MAINTSERNVYYEHQIVCIVT